LVGFFVASYTGALLTATNQPIWSDSPWVSALFLASAASTGLAALGLAARLRRDVDPKTLEKLRRAEVGVIVLEVATLAVFLGSLSSLARPLLASSPGILLVTGTAVVGGALPAALHLRPRAPERFGAVAAPLLVLTGGWLMRFSILSAAPAMLAQAE
jgi:formate-dependent nitrite reductase membrane component NrfD